MWPLPGANQTYTQFFADLWSADSSKKHTGVDVAAARGTQVYAARDGVVSRVGDLGLDPNSNSYGRYVIVSLPGPPATCT